MFFHSAGLDKGTFCGLIALMFCLFVGFIFLYVFQLAFVYDSGQINSGNQDWIIHSYYSWGVLVSLGGILAGQIRRVYPIEHNPALPLLRNSDCSSAIASLFTGSVFMAWGTSYNDPWSDKQTMLDKWCYIPYIFFFAFIASGTHQYLRVRQDARQWAAIALITVSMLLVIIGYPQQQFTYTYFNGWALTFFIFSVISYSHFWVKLEFILKRRACNVFEVAEKFGIVLLFIYTVCILITSIFQWCAGYDWIFGVYIKAVFTNSAANFFLTIGVIFVLGALELIVLSLIYNSSSLRFLTILFMPTAFLSMFYFQTNWLFITAHVLFFAGLATYNATTVCGSEAIREQKIEMAYDAYEDEHFARVQNDGQVNAQYSANNMV